MADSESRDAPQPVARATRSIENLELFEITLCSCHPPLPHTGIVSVTRVEEKQDAHDH